MSEGHTVSKAALLVLVMFLVPFFLIILTNSNSAHFVQCVWGLLVSGSLLLVLALIFKLIAYREDNERRQ